MRKLTSFFKFPGAVVHTPPCPGAMSRRQELAHNQSVLAQRLLKVPLTYHRGSPKPAAGERSSGPGDTAAESPTATERLHARCRLEIFSGTEMLMFADVRYGKGAMQLGYKMLLNCSVFTFVLLVTDSADPHSSTEAGP